MASSNLTSKAGILLRQCLAAQKKNVRLFQHACSSTTAATTSSSSSSLSQPPPQEQTGVLSYAFSQQVRSFRKGETSNFFTANRPVSSSAREETAEEETEGGEDSSSTSACTCYDVGCSSNIKWHESPVTRVAREKQLNQRGCVLWLTGLSGSGKSTVAFTLEHILQEQGKVCYVLDGDNLRHGLNQDLNFSAASREENIRRIGEVAKMMAQAGIITVVSIISPYAKDRNKARSMMREHASSSSSVTSRKDFIEVYLKIPISVCEERDPKGLYKKVREGKIKGFTGVDAPYEEPLNPEIVLEDGDKTPEEMARELFDYLQSNHYLSF